MENLRAEYGSEAFKQIEFVEADLNDSQSVKNAVHGCSYVIHVASPTTDPTSRYSKAYMINANKTGTRAILEAALEFKVKKVVVTSSIAAIVA